jgi:uncharacterized protein (DUF3084 family)
MTSVKVGQPRVSWFLMLLVCVSVATLVIGVVEAIIGAFMVTNSTFQPLFVISGIAIAVGGLAMLAASASIVQTEATIKDVKSAVVPLQTDVRTLGGRVDASIESTQKSTAEIAEKVEGQGKKTEDSVSEIRDWMRAAERLANVESDTNELRKDLFKLAEEVRASSALLARVRKERSTPEKVETKPGAKRRKTGARRASRSGRSRS